MKMIAENKMLPSSKIEDTLDKFKMTGELAPSFNQVHVLVVVPVKLPTPHELRDSQLVVDGVSIHMPASMQLNPPALVAFWKAFLAVPTEVEADAVIALPEGTFLLGDSTLGSRIYVRRCYPQLWKVCWKMIHDKVTKTPHLVILGNPGIGKTFFGYIILLHLARAGATVVYESGGSKKRLLFSRDMVVQGSQQDLLVFSTSLQRTTLWMPSLVGILDQPRTYYIVDAVKPTYYPAKTILLTSPRRSVWFEFNKTNSTIVQDCFRRWGGIARYVLRYAQLDDQQELLEKAIAFVDINWLVDACGKLDADDAEVSHQLLHYRVSECFTNDYFVFASQYVEQEVYKRLYVKDKQKLLNFISASDGIGALAVPRGHLFEGHVHSVLPRGGTFRIRHLADDGEVHDDDEYLTEEDWGEGEGNDYAMDADDDAAMEDSTATVRDLDDGVSTLLSERPTVIFNNDEEVIAADTAIYLRPEKL
ncbi:hypothetical protein PF005_g3257 [Phytophthora fragariae]|uniref:Crinkler effector protein N-terminal domain-containing protein n=1 Tax=Phytophthora fragariae TaxID=53985 RepID=A0A6A3MCZ1_9STRA|nr:hypothetical protein PF003_g8474 [Phytophthora fragariae]KAE9026374.1 hypothetical protein PF011_g2604 [Phytophthora fragariae]KAE9133501.1 hypothetical protein PF010_g2801 [Phytophthora fragariae]KAE9133751.1 hypothetical protein PF007_g3225 [Phytophthora fragariae]KAE9231057.1 hypothetical protein PF005_g3257 [Phytophthora fragariae]